jgi:hypothetical protein
MPIKQVSTKSGDSDAAPFQAEAEMTAADFDVVTGPVAPPMHVSRVPERAHRPEATAPKPTLEGEDSPLEPGGAANTAARP